MLVSKLTSCRFAVAIFFTTLGIRAVIAGTPPCPADLNNNGTVNAADLAILLGAWGPNPGHAADLTGDGMINASDLAGLLGNWGLCSDCTSPAECDDGQFCNGVELCLAGRCEPGDPPSCTDADPCTTDTCDVVDGCVHTPGGPCNNDCQDAFPITNGNTPYDTTGSTTDGVGHAGCQFEGQTFNDIWYHYTATCTGTLSVSTCGLAAYDTDLVVYEGCTCAGMQFLACNDNAAGCPDAGSEVAVEVVTGSCYTIRVGGSAEAITGSGTLSIACEPVCVTQQDCDDDNPCTDDSCDPVLGCLHDPNTAPCNDGLFCNGADSCKGGSCSLHSGDPCAGGPQCANSCNETTNDCNDLAGITCGNVAETDCDAPDTCDGNGNCLPNLMPNGTLCSDGNGCTNPDNCQGGQCTPGAVNCDDGNVCTADSCDPVSGCLHTPVPGPCNDGLFCNGADSCSGGTCSLHAGSPCPGTDDDVNCAESCDEALNNCTAADPNGANCNDFVFCNGTDKCFNGTCSNHSGNPCPGPDGDGDCTESCSELTDDCTAIDPNGTTCTDGLFCNGVDACNGGACTIHSGNPCPGGDGDSDCTESCNENADTCDGPDVNGAPCNDGIFCNGADSCVSGLCVAHSGFPCASGQTCHEGTDQCTCVTSSQCNDNNACTSDACAGGFCTHGTQPVGTPCGSNSNTNCDNPDTCDANGICQPNFEFDGALCFDKDFCNGPNACQSGLCVPIGQPADCDDGNPCTLDECDPVAGCINTPIEPCP